MKKTAFFIFLLLPCFVYSEGITLNLGNANFFLDTKIMKDGSITNVGLGINYNDILGGEIRGQSEITSTNEEINDPTVADSLIAIKEDIYELYLLPIQYRASINLNSQWKAGVGLYYEYQKTNEKGFMDMPVLETLGFARINSYTDDFSMHLLGPLIDAIAKYNAEWFNVRLSFGIVPIFFLTTNEKQKMIPLFETVNHSQNTWGSPYLYLGLNSIFFKYVNLAVNYNYALLKYDVIDLDFDEKEAKFIPIFPENKVVSHSLMIEVSALLPLGGMNFQIGYGYIHNSYTINSDNPVSNNKQYIILSVKNLVF